MLLTVLMLLYGDLPQVHNGLALSEPSKDVRFIEELRFGAEPNKPDEYQWSGVCVKVSVGPDGRIYVADTGENRVLCFDDQGQFIKLVSQKGNGPGEFQTLIFFSVLQNGEAVAMDAFNDTGRFFYFNAEPKFVHQISPKPGSVRRSHLSPDGQLLWAHYIGPYSASFEVSTGVMNARFEWIEKLTTTAMEPFDGSQMRDPGYLRKRFAKNIAQDLGTRGLAGFGEHGEAFTARSDAYIITRWEKGMSRPIQKIQKDFQPQLRTAAQTEMLIEDYRARFLADIPPIAELITPGLIADALEKSEVSPVKPPLTGLLVTTQGTLLAVRGTSDDGTQTADVFNRSGTWIGRATVPNQGFVDSDFGPNMVFRNGLAYCIETVDGTFQVVRYRVVEEGP